MSDSSFKTELIADVFDRLQEAHFWIHALEKYYHFPDEFRWHLNSFLKCIKEIPQLIMIKLQNKAGFKEWFKSKRQLINADNLLSELSKTRDYVVHAGSLTLKSSGSIGITKGRGMKLGIDIPIDPRESSDDAMNWFVARLAYTGDFFGFLSNDEDTMPCVQRIWNLPNIDGEVIDLCAQAWLTISSIVLDTIEWLGGERPQYDLSCRHSAQYVRFKLYERNPLRAELRRLRASDGFERAPRDKNYEPDWADRGEKDWVASSI